MTKEEKIKEAYGEFWGGSKNTVTSDGWDERWIYEPVIDNFFDYKQVSRYAYIRRPKSLQGIENNNEWIKIESENDLPKEEGLYFVIRAHSKSKTVESLEGLMSNYHGYRATHYQKLHFPKDNVY